MSPQNYFVENSKPESKLLPLLKKRMKNKYPELAVDWKKIYSLPFVVTTETKIRREFQYKLLNDIVFTNEKLFPFKMIDSHLYAPFVRKMLNPSNMYCFTALL